MNAVTTTSITDGNPQSAATGRARGPFGTLLGVLFRPSSTFIALRDAKRRWWIVPALLALVLIAVHGFTDARVSTALLNQQSQMREVPIKDPYGGGAIDGPGGMPSQLGPHPLTIGLTIGGRLVGTVVSWLLWAGLLALASTFFGQNGANFGGFFAMVTWARLPFTLRSLVQTLYMTLTGTLIYNQGLSGLVLDNRPAATAAGVINGPGLNGMMGGARYIPPSLGQQVAAAVLGQIDIYLVWSLLLMVAGVWAFARLSRRKALLVTLAIWVLGIGVGLLPTFIGLGQGVRLF
jgi:hypothetical protein